MENKYNFCFVGLSDSTIGAILELQKNNSGIRVCVFEDLSEESWMEQIKYIDKVYCAENDDKKKPKKEKIFNKKKRKYNKELNKKILENDKVFDRYEHTTHNFVKNQSRYSWILGPKSGLRRKKNWKENNLDYQTILNEWSNNSIKNGNDNFFYKKIEENVSSIGYDNVKYYKSNDNEHINIIKKTQKILDGIDGLDIFYECCVKKILFDGEKKDKLVANTITIFDSKNNEFADFNGFDQLVLSCGTLATIRLLKQSGIVSEGNNENIVLKNENIGLDIKCNAILYRYFKLFRRFKYLIHNYETAIHKFANIAIIQIIFGFVISFVYNVLYMNWFTIYVNVLFISLLSILSYSMSFVAYDNNYLIYGKLLGLLPTMAFFFYTSLSLSIIILYYSLYYGVGYVFYLLLHIIYNKLHPPPLITRKGSKIYSGNCVVDYNNHNINYSDIIIGEISNYKVNTILKALLKTIYTLLDFFLLFDIWMNMDIVCERIIQHNVKATFVYQQNSSTGKWCLKTDYMKNKENFKEIKKTALITNKLTKGLVSFEKHTKYHENVSKHENYNDIKKEVNFGGEMTGGCILSSNKNKGVVNVNYNMYGTLNLYIIGNPTIKSNRLTYPSSTTSLVLGIHFIKRWTNKKQ